MFRIILLRITYVRKNRIVTDESIVVRTIPLSLSLGEPGGRGSFTGDPAGYVEEGCGDGHLSQ
jgi:hypothetical protein